MENNEKGKKRGTKRDNNIRPRGTSRVRRAALDVIMVCLAVIVVFSGWKIWSIQHEYRENRASYDRIADEAYGEDSGAAEAESGIDFYALRAINPDVVAWIRYDGTAIDYPVVQGTDNDKYLHTLFDGSYGGCGTLFVEAVTERPFKQSNTIVYGHHMRDGSMFATLKELRDPEFCREHPELELITPDGRYRLQIWAFLNQPADSGIYATNFHIKEDQREYIELIRSSAEYLTGVDDSVTERDRIVILSTCAYEYENARYIAACRMQPAE